MLMRIVERIKKTVGKLSENNNLFLNNERKIEYLRWEEYILKGKLSVFSERKYL